MENLERVNSNIVDDYDPCDGTVELADTHRAQSDPSLFGSDGREEVLGCIVYEKSDTFSLCVALNDVYTFEAAKLHAFALLTDKHKWAYSSSKPKNELTFFSEKRKVRAKTKANLLFVHHVRHWRIATADRRTESENRMRCLRSKKTFGYTIENAQCVHPVRLRKPRHVQPQREHDYTSPANRRRSQHVSFWTIAMMILEYSRT